MAHELCITINGNRWREDITARLAHSDKLEAFVLRKAKEILKCLHKAPGRYYDVIDDVRGEWDVWETGNSPIRGGTINTGIRVEELH